MSDTHANAAGEPAGVAQRILDAALDLGERRGWDAVHLYDVAQEMGIGIAEIARYYGGKNELAEAWFDRADEALLAAPQEVDWLELSPRERLHRAIFYWLDALAAHRRLTASMLRYKLQPDHPHLQVLGLLRISRTVQWLREAAQLPAVGWRREAEEVALTAIYLATFARWLGDDSPGAKRTRLLLDSLLGRAERIALRLPQAAPRDRSRKTGSAGTPPAPA